MRAPSSLPFSFSPTPTPPTSSPPHVGSSLRLHFSCLGSLLSSPANKSSANLLPESLCPCSNCSSPPLRGNHQRRRGRASPSEGGRGGGGEGGVAEEGGREEEGVSGLEALPNGHPLCRNNRLLSLSVFQGASAFSPALSFFPPSKANRALLWSWRGDI